MAMEMKNDMISTKLGDDGDNVTLMRKNSKYGDMSKEITNTPLATRMYVFASFSRFETTSHTVLNTQVPESAELLSIVFSTRVAWWMHGCERERECCESRVG